MTLDWNRLFPIWWSFFWRAAIYGLIGGFVLGAVFGAIAGATGHLDKASLYGGVGGYIAGIPASMLALKQTLSLHLESFASLGRSANT
jgi:hypothetical protein